MGFPLTLAFRYMRSKKQASVSVGTTFAVLGVALGVSALATVISVTGGFRSEFRTKVLGVNAHVLVLKYASDFREYRKVMDQVKTVPGVTAVAPFVINPMMVTHGNRTATGVLLKGIDPKLAPQVLDLPGHIKRGSLAGLRVDGAKPPERRRQSILDDSLRPPLFESPSAAPRASAAAPASSGAVPVASSSAAPLASATSHEGLLGAIEREIRQAPDVTSRPTAALHDAGAAEAADPSDDGDRASGALDIEPGAPVGSIEPDGGFANALPENDELPEWLDPDPCKSPEAVAKLPGIVIGGTLSANLSAKLGDCLQVTSPTIGFVYSRGAMHAPVAKQFRVIAVFEAGFDQYDSKLVYTDLYEAQAFYDSGDSVTGVEMKVSDIEQASDVKKLVEDKLASGIYHTMDWEELNHGLFTALRIQQIMMSFVLALIIIVAAFTVIATLIMVVLDKKKEIAVVKAMGARDGAVLRVFLYQGGIIGALGTAVGLVLGYGVCKVLMAYPLRLDPKVYFISRLPVAMHLSDFALVGAFAVLVCLLATVWPALHAAYLRPAEAFRDNR
ncbi:MAG TPA: ABC transporter permease [Polyangiaceae bacterium]|nr:ABC transporter permease [Polyangiaceae bacterium]